MLCTCLLVVRLQQHKAKQMPLPLSFKALKGAAVKLLACRTRGPGINPRLDRSNSVIVYLLFYFFVLFSLTEKMEGALMLQMPPSKASGQ